MVPRQRDVWCSASESCFNGRSRKGLRSFTNMLKCFVLFVSIQCMLGVSTRFWDEGPLSVQCVGCQTDSFISFIPAI